MDGVTVIVNGTAVTGLEDLFWGLVLGALVGVVLGLIITSFMDL